MFYVYLITNIINKKVYVGITTRKVEDRWLEHVSRSRYPDKYNSKIHAAIRKYGEANFSISILACTQDLDSLLLLEKELIEDYNSTELGYNLTSGGRYCSMTQDTKDKISRTKLGHAVSKETREKFRINTRNCWQRSDYRRKNTTERSSFWKITYSNGEEETVQGLKQKLNLTKSDYNHLVLKRYSKKLNIIQLEKLENRGTYFG